MAQQISTVVTPLALTAGVGIYGNTAFTINSQFTTNRASYESTAMISNLLLVIAQAAGNVTLGISAGTLANLKSLGASVGGNYCPCLGDSLPSNLSASVGNSGLISGVSATANTIMSNATVFVQAFSAAKGYADLTNSVIESAVNANNYLGPTFTNQDNLITGDLMRVNPALPAFGEDLRNLGNLFDFDNFGTPSALLAKLAEQGNMINGTLPAVQAALQAQGLTRQDISDLVTQNRESLFNPGGLTENQFDRLQKQAYPALCDINGADLQEVLTILGVTTADITSMCELLDPVRIFPLSYASLTLPTPAGDILIYNTDGSVNSAVPKVLNSGTLVPQGCDQLAKIIPPAQAAANRAIQVAFGQVKNLYQARLPEVAHSMTITLSTLKGLDLVANVATPIPASVAAFYSGTIAQGTGPNGTFLITDLLPGASGIRENPALEAAIELIANPVTAGLATIYSQMVSVVNSTYGDPAVPPNTIVIPSGPAAGTYSSYDDALAALIAAATAAIGTIVNTSTVSGLVTRANSTWTTMTKAWSRSPNALANASINLSQLPATAQLPVTAFIAGLDQQGTDTEVGMSAQYLQSVANTATQSGQALIGCLRESRNSAALDAARIGRDNDVPDQPTTPPPQANLGDANFTVTEARAYVQANLSP